jgi:hypothetical protein
VQDYYAPIITAFEAQIAFTPGSEWTGEYHLKFDCLLVSRMTLLQLRCAASHQVGVAQAMLI